MDDTFAAGLRTALLSEVANQSRASRRRRSRTITASVVTVVAVGVGAAVAATVVTNPPGGVDVAPLAPVVTVDGSGTQRVHLGAPPASANRIELQLTCLTVGTFTFADGASVQCERHDVDRSVTTYSLPISPGRPWTTITAGRGERWHLIAQYANASTTPWGVNAHGHTYGVINSNGIPDLVAVMATNGKQGYVYADQLQATTPDGTSPSQASKDAPSSKTLPVYASDGTTVIGAFVIAPRNDR